MKKQLPDKIYAFIIIAMMFSTTVNAQIVYTDVNPDSTLKASRIFFDSKTYQLDLNNDGIKDFTISVKHFGKTGGYAYVNVKPLNGNKISGYTNTNGASQFTLATSITNSNHWISDSSYLKRRCWTMDYPKCGTDMGSWVNDSIRYLGLKIITGSNSYYGWIRLKIKIGTFGFNNQFTIYDYAYNSIANQPIRAGEISCTTPSVTLTASGPLNFCNGDSVMLTANGTGYQYQWKKGGTKIAGATSKMYVAKTAGTYKCKVTNSCGSITSSGKTVTIPCRMNQVANNNNSFTTQHLSEKTSDLSYQQKFSNESNETDNLKQIPDSPDKFILKSMKQHHIPGLSAAIIKNGKVAWTKGYGYADIEKNIPFTPNTINAEIGSISKSIVATAIMKLWQEGLFGLDDQINNYLPFTINNPYFPNIPITFRMLLNHSSSIGENGELFDIFLYNFDFNNSPSESLGNYVYDILNPGGALYVDSVYFNNYPPGSLYSYSNFGYVVLGYLVERISGDSFDHYCKVHIFQPLCMNHTGWYFHEVDTNIVSRPYYFDDQSNTWVDYGLYQYPDYPDGQIKTTAADLSRYLLMYMNNGILDGARILDSTTIAVMHTIQPQDSTYDHSFQVGLGWFSYHNNEWWGHAGGDLGVSADMQYNFTNNIGVVLLTNGEDNSTGTPYCTNTDDILCELMQLGDRISTTVLPELNCAYVSNKCEHSKTYWKNNVDKWALNSVPMKLGTQNFYAKNQVLNLLNKPDDGNASNILVKQLIAAKLNAAQGSELSPIIQKINEANNLIGNRHLPIQAKILFFTTEGIQMLALAAQLALYNSGTLNTEACNGNGNREAEQSEGIYENDFVEHAVNISPNPFSNSTIISFSLTELQNVSLKIYDVNGRLVKTLTDNIFEEGEHSVEWEAEKVSAGIYFLQIQSTEFTKTERLILTK